MPGDVLTSYQELQGLEMDPVERDLLDQAILQILEAWPYQRKHLRRAGGRLTLEFQPGFGRVDVGFSPVSIKPKKQ
jgi:hypothetical protein